MLKLAQDFRIDQMESIAAQSLATEDAEKPARKQPQTSTNQQLL